MFCIIYDVKLPVPVGFMEGVDTLMMPINVSMPTAHAHLTKNFGINRHGLKCCSV